MIDTFESKNPGVGSDHLLQRFLARYWRASAPMPLEQLRDGTTVGTTDARVDHGRWIVDCPTRCGEASPVMDSDLRFVCVNCGVGPYLVVLPPERDGIEAALDVRPVENRNWFPGESVGDLRKETNRHRPDLEPDDKPGKPAKGKK